MRGSEEARGRDWMLEAGMGWEGARVVWEGRRMTVKKEKAKDDGWARAGREVKEEEEIEQGVKGGSRATRGPAPLAKLDTLLCSTPADIRNPTSSHSASTKSSGGCTTGTSRRPVGHLPQCPSQKTQPGLLCESLHTSSPPRPLGTRPRDRANTQGPERNTLPGRRRHAPRQSVDRAVLAS